MKQKKQKEYEIADLDNKKLIMGSLPNLGLTLAILLGVLLFKLNTYILMGLLLLFNLASFVLQAKKKGWVFERWGFRLISSSFTLLVTISLLVVINKWLGVYGFVGLLVSGLLVGLLVLFRRWNYFLGVVRGVEKKIWGFTMEERRDMKKKKVKEND